MYVYFWKGYIPKSLVSVNMALSCSYSDTDQFYALIFLFAFILIEFINKINWYRYRVFIKYCVFSLKFCDFSELCQFCCSTGFLPAWCVYTH